MDLLARFAEQCQRELKEQGIRLAVIGDIDELTTPARRAIEDAVAFTADGPEMVLSLALSYGGRWDLVNAIRALAVEVRTGLLLPEEIDEKRLGDQMSTRDLPDVDLLIRTGGESRVSDFLLFESAYAELLVLPKMWPDFDEADVRHAMRHYSATERRFGVTSVQLAGRSAGQGFDPHDSVVVAAE
jgi:undecaprenyl diphosphate synthase